MKKTFFIYIHLGIIALSIVAFSFFNSKRFQAALNPTQAHVCFLLADVRSSYWQSIYYGANLAAEKNNISIESYDQQNEVINPNQQVNMQPCFNSDVVINSWTLTTPLTTELKNTAHIQYLNTTLPQSLNAVPLSIAYKTTDKANKLINLINHQYANPVITPFNIALMLAKDSNRAYSQLTEQLKTAFVNTPHITFVQPSFANDDFLSQSIAFSELLTDNPKIDLIIGTEMAIIVAEKYFQAKTRAHAAELVSLSLSAPILQRIKTGTVSAALLDNPVILGQYTIEQALKSLSIAITTPIKAPEIKLITQANTAQVDALTAFAPNGYRVIYNGQ